MTGYLDNPEATDAAFAHGWFHSGDVGPLRRRRRALVRRPVKDVIKTGGENVASIEVEKARLRRRPRHRRGVVVGLPHERWTEAITAVVVPKSGATIDEAELLAALQRRLDGYKVPKAIIVVDELPKTSTGKIQKNVVRDNTRRTTRADLGRLLLRPVLEPPPGLLAPAAARCPRPASWPGSGRPA